ncbi:MAG: outer membrane protein assembly factor BamA [Spirochaetota bacterium]
MRRTLQALFILAVFAVPLAAQNGEWYLDQTIRDVEFVGLSSVSQSELDPIVRPYLGEPFTDNRFLELQRRLYALDFFESIVPEAVRPETGDGVIIRFTVEERPTIDEIRFVGNRRIRTADLLSEIVLTRGDMLTRAKRRVDEQAILDLYLERGHPDVEVSSRVEVEEERGEKRTVLVFTIDEGQRVTVREINFSGNDFASASTLRGRMETKAQSIFNSGVYQDRVLEEDRLRILEYYRERGYVDAEIEEIARETERDEEEERTDLILTVFIEEGNQYTFEGIEFEGNTIFSDEELAELVRVREDAVLDAIRLEEGIGQVQDRYYQSGYIYNAFNVTEDRDEQALSISYTVEITEQPRAHIENIIIRGNDKTADEVILREIPLEVGDVFSVSRIREGIHDLTNLQYFSAVNPETPEGSVEGLMDLVINVEEAQTADITFGVSFGGGADFPVSARVGWNDRNFRGQGQTLGFQAQFSPFEQRLTLDFLERWFAGERWSVGADLSVNRSVRQGVEQDILAPVFDADDPNRVPDPYEGIYVFGSDPPDDSPYAAYEAGDVFPDPVTDDLIEEYDLVTDYAYARENDEAIPEEYLMDYTEWSIGIGGNTGYRFRTTLGTLTLSTNLRSSLNYVGYDPSRVRPHSPELRANLDDWQLVNKWGITSTLDRRRGLALSPSSGYVFSQGVTFAGGFLFGDRHYIRTDSRAEGYVTLWDVPVFENWNYKTVLAAHSDISFILPTPRIHGVDSSWPEPVAGGDLLATNQMFIARGWDPVTDGEALWNNWLELRTPIAEQVVWADTFLDGVRLWTDTEQIGQGKIDDMLFGLGAGFRFTIPQFPIRIYLVKRFRVVEDPSSAVGLGIRGQQGDLFNFNDTATGGLDFVFSIGADLF